MKAHTSILYKQHQRGFSLIELMVSVGLFAVVMTVSVSTLLALISANQKAQSLKSVINNLNVSLENMARTIRTGRDYTCTSSPSTLPTLPEDCLNGETGLVLTDDQGVRLAYRLSGGRIERKLASGSPWVAMTAEEVVITDMLFYVTGTAAWPPEGIQPSVTISIRGRTGPNPSTESSFNIETSVVQRVLDD